VLHRHATDSALEQRLNKISTFVAVQTRHELVALKQSTRNTPALFGAGQIDAIPDKVLRDAEKRFFSDFPEIQGRVSVLPDGRIGRFGWKAQVSNLREFVLAACANELGLEVPDRHQVSLARAAEFNPSNLKLDLVEEECSRLVRYVSSLPRPRRGPPDNGSLPPWGYTVFQSIGCATCHAPRLGDVQGMYSDLLLHDLGDRMSAGGGYGGPARVVDLATANDQPRSSGPARTLEWRTPPLWGVADSAPYLHDGRAVTLDEAIRLHGGEAAKTASRYNGLNSRDRKALLGFLRSLSVSAPGRLREPAASTTSPKAASTATPAAARATTRPRRCFTLM
jgi:CxxC motif-containing protein (DUF1111 family)